MLVSSSDIIGLEDRSSVFNLFARLGYADANRPNPADISPEFTRGDPTLAPITKMLRVGSVAPSNPGGLPLTVYLVESQTLRNILPRLARRMREQPEHILLVTAAAGDDNRYRELAFSNIRVIPRGIRTPIVSLRTLTVTRSHPSAHDLTVLQSLVVQRLTAEDAFLSQVDAFDVERLTNRFYIEYRERFDLSKEVIRKANRSLVSFTDKERGSEVLHGFTQRLLSRLLFVYFLQKKGWLAGDLHFLENWFARIGGKKDGAYFSGFLERLFFEVFSTERSSDDSPFGSIPYLNGGLFERNSVFDVEGVRVPDSVFDPESESSILNLFKKYNFTVSEDSEEEAEVALAPELLGKVFENLLAADERHKSGSYYTPRSIVRSMCRDTLSRHLSRALSHFKADWNEDFFLGFFESEDGRDRLHFSEREAQEILSELLSIRVLDPAVGSGAFLLGMLHAMLEVHRVVQSARGMRYDSRRGAYTELKERIIRDQLFGVDIIPEAVEMCRLRLWLSLVVDQERDAVRPLPNLDYNVMRGDSLRQNVAGVTIFRVPGRAKQFGLEEYEPDADFGELYRTVKKLPDLKRRFASEHDPRLKVRLRREIDEALQSTMEMAVRQQLTRLGALLESKGRGTTAGRAGREVRRLEEQESRLTDQLARLRDRAWSTFFPYEMHFADVFEQRGGFDIVIGNPPYLEDETYTELMEELALGSNNLFGLFWARAITDLCRNGGQVSFITPDTLLTIKSHAALRERLLRCTIVHVLNLPYWFFTFHMAYTCVLTAVRAPPNQDHEIVVVDLTQAPVGDHQALETAIGTVRTDWSGPTDLKLGQGRGSMPAARYRYLQSALHDSTLCPIPIADPAFFPFLKDQGKYAASGQQSTLTYGPDRRRVPVRGVRLSRNGLTMYFAALGELADSKQGIATGDNQSYIRMNAREGIDSEVGRYPPVDPAKTVTPADLAKISRTPKKYQEEGIAPGEFDGRCFVPLDMSGRFDESGNPPWLIPRVEYWIDWSAAAVKKMKTLTIADRKKAQGERPSSGDSDKIAAVIRNSEFYFRKGITSVRVGDQAPIVRIFAGGIFDSQANCIFSYDASWVPALAVYLNSPIARYLSRCFINSSFNLQTKDILQVPVPVDILRDTPDEFLRLLDIADNQRGKVTSKDWEPVIERLADMLQFDQRLRNEVKQYVRRRYPRFFDLYYGES